MEEFDDSFLSYGFDSRSNMSVMMDLCFAVQEALKIDLMEGVSDFAFKRGLIQRPVVIGGGYNLNGVVAQIQKALEKENLSSSRPWTTEELFNWTIMGISTWKTGENSYQFIYQFWTKYMDCYIRVSELIGNKKLKIKLQRMKKTLLVKYGPPPFVADSTFQYVHMTYPPTKDEPIVVTLPQSLPNDVTIIKKSEVNIIVLGNEESGKSTVIFDLICRWNKVDKATLNKFEEEKMPAFKHAVKFIVANGVDAADVTMYKFETPNCCVKIVDPLGRTDFTENSNTLSQVDCAVLLISAGFNEFGVDEFEAGINQTIQHARAAYEKGIKSLIVVVNKMDVTPELRYSEARYAEIKKTLGQHIQKIGYNLDLIPFVPISAWHGDNVLDCSSNLPWYEGFDIERGGVASKAKTLMEVLDTIMPESSVTGDDNLLHFHDVVPDPGWKTRSLKRRPRQYEPIYTKDVAICGKITQLCGN